MSDVYQSEVNPDEEPGEELQEALRGAAGDEDEDEDDDDDLDENGNVDDDDPDL